MSKTILITGATDGIGLEAAKLLRTGGHDLLLHGRNEEKLKAISTRLRAFDGSGRITTYRADLSTIAETRELARTILMNEPRLDVLINNAGVFSTGAPRTIDGLDARFAVNTIAPYILARALAPLLGKNGRVINLSSAAQSPVEAGALEGQLTLSDNGAYSQSKLALTMWNNLLAAAAGDEGPSFVAVNPGSFLASKMVKEAYGMQGNDLSIGAEILARAAVDAEFGHPANGRYFDNDRGAFGNPHPDALDPDKNALIVKRIEAILAGSTKVIAGSS